MLRSAGRLSSYHIDFLLCNARNKWHDTQTKATCSSHAFCGLVRLLREAFRTAGGDTHYPSIPISIRPDRCSTGKFHYTALNDSLRDVIITSQWSALICWQQRREERRKKALGCGGIATCTDDRTELVPNLQ